MTTKTGTLLNAPLPGNENLARAVLSPSRAIMEAIAAYLRTATFWVTGSVPPRSFVFRDVTAEWPDASKELPVPIAVLTEMRPTRTEAARMVPTPLEESLDVFAPCSVLWKLGEAECELALDCWTYSDAERVAIRAGLPGLFSPDETSVALLAAPPEYYSLTVRAELVDVVDRDAPGTVYAHERRLRARLRGTVDIVQLRRASLLSPQVETRVVTAGEE